MARLLFFVVAAFALSACSQMEISERVPSADREDSDSGMSY